MILKSLLVQRGTQVQRKKNVFPPVFFTDAMAWRGKKKPERALGSSILYHTRNVKIPEMERIVALLQKICCADVSLVDLLKCIIM